MIDRDDRDRDGREGERDGEMDIWRQEGRRNRGEGIGEKGGEGEGEERERKVGRGRER
jgi:hypothetical protein